MRGTDLRPVAPASVPADLRPRLENLERFKFQQLDAYTGAIDLSAAIGAMDAAGAEAVLALALRLKAGGRRNLFPRTRWMLYALLTGTNR